MLRSSCQKGSLRAQVFGPGFGVQPDARGAHSAASSSISESLDPTQNTYGDQPPNIFATRPIASAATSAPLAAGPPPAAPPPPPRCPWRLRGRCPSTRRRARCRRRPPLLPENAFAKNPKRDDDDDAAPRPPIAPPPPRAPARRSAALGGSFGGGPPVGGYPFGSAPQSFPQPPSHSITGSGDDTENSAHPGHGSVVPE